MMGMAGWRPKTTALVSKNELLQMFGHHPDLQQEFAQGAEFFFCAFEIADPNIPILTIYKALVAKSLISQAMALELWDASTSWTTKMVAGMSLFGDWLFLEAEAMDDDKECRLAGGLGKKYLRPLQMQLPKAKDVRGGRRMNIDRQRRHLMATVPEQGEAVIWTIIDLNIMCDTYWAMFDDTGSIPDPVRRVINALMVACYAWRTYPGRPGELEQFPLDEMHIKRD